MAAGEAKWSDRGSAGAAITVIRRGRTAVSDWPARWCGGGGCVGSMGRGTPHWQSDAARPQWLVAASAALLEQQEGATWQQEAGSKAGPCGRHETSPMARSIG
jgi:hypothetical protein